MFILDLHKEDLYGRSKMSGTNNQIGDSKKFQERRSLTFQNANMFISNNNNPFMVSPYSYPTNVAKQTEVTNISSLISTFIGNLSSIIDLSTYTLSISTITNIPSDVPGTVTISTFQIILDAPNTTVKVDLTVDGDSYFIGNTFFNNISTGSLFASVADISSLSVSTINVNDENINFLTVNSTLNASTISTGSIFASSGDFSTISVSTLSANYGIFNDLTVNSTLNISSMAATGPIDFITMIGSTITVSTLTVNSTLNISSMAATGPIDFITMIGSTITVSTLTVNSTLNISSMTATGPISFVTLTGGTITTNSLTVNSTIFASTLELHTIDVSTVNAFSINVSTVNASTTSTSTVNAHTIGVSSMTATGLITYNKLSGDELIFSSFCMIPSTISTGVTTPLHSSILICLNGSYWKIPIQPA
jgi:hypothetical protein